MEYYVCKSCTEAKKRPCIIVFSLPEGLTVPGPTRCPWPDCETGIKPRWRKRKTRPKELDAKDSRST